ncbi:unnamed protein product [Protopolystoma xenopodis]|uniref:Uncharacterized protein n=1 Tax=Protopolystoma xenopodis TaxID=117903 RepID=A0A3S5CSD1_9PLAT|nr:unnamed protein product [Protopolystoma xenopodis]
MRLDWLWEQLSSAVKEWLDQMDAGGQAKKCSDALNNFQTWLVSIQSDVAVFDMPSDLQTRELIPPEHYGDFFLLFCLLSD